MLREYARNMEHKSRIISRLTTFVCIIILGCLLGVSAQAATSIPSYNSFLVEVKGALDVVYAELSMILKKDDWDQRQITMLDEYMKTVQYIQDQWNRMIDKPCDYYQDQSGLLFWFSETDKGKYYEKNITASISEGCYSFRLDDYSTIGVSDYFCLINYCKSNELETISLIKRLPDDEADKKYDIIISENGYLLNKNNTPLLHEKVASWDDEVLGINELIQCNDLAPIFDSTGPATYEIRFDICASKPGPVLVYMQNGTNSRYIFEVYVNATTEYMRQAILVNPIMDDPSIEQSLLAFYGIYDSGVIPSIKNLEIIKLY